MKLIAIALARNEEKIIPYYVHHYASIADKIVIIDHESTDSTVKVALETANKLGANLEILKLKNEGFDDVLSMRLKENIYLMYQNDYDVAIVGDCDEFWNHPNGLRKEIESYLMYNDGKLAIEPIGYQMMSSSFPEYSGQPMTSIIKTGVYDRGFSKPLCFSTKLKLVGTLGMHTARHFDNDGNEVIPLRTTGIQLLHYKLLGFDYAYDRLCSTRDNLSKLGKDLASNGIGKHLIEEREKLKLGFDELYQKCIKEGFTLDNV